MLLRHNHYSRLCSVIERVSCSQGCLCLSVSQGVLQGFAGQSNNTFQFQTQNNNYHAVNLLN